MFKKWLETHDLTEYPFDTPLFVPAADRDFWDPHRDEAFVSSAESYLGFEIPPLRATQFMAFNARGDRLAYENPHFARRRALIALALGELCEYKGRFLPDLCDVLLAVCEETFWGVSAHVIESPFPPADRDYIDLFAAETGEIVAVILALLEPELEAFCPPITRRMKNELRRRILDPYLRHSDWWWMGRGMPVNNWNPWILSNVLTAYLCAPERDGSFYRALTKIFEEIDFWYLAQPEDGGCDEGASYFTQAGGKFFELCDQLFVSTGGAINFFGDEKTKQIGLYEYRMYIGDGCFVNFADGTPRLSADLDWIAYGFGLRIGDDRLKSLGREMLRFKHPLADGKALFNAALTRENKIKRDLYSLIYREEIASAPPFSPEKRTLLPELQVAVVRDGGWTLAAKGGSNAESHNHNDVGSFIAYYDSAPVLVDPSCGTYTKQTFSEGRYDIWTMSSAWHNVPTLSEADQLEGAQRRADAFSLDGDTVAVSFAAAYGDEAGVRRLERKLSAAGGKIALEDRVALGERGAIGEHFVTPLPVRIEGKRAILGERFALSCDCGEGGDVSLTVGSVGFDGDPKLTEYWRTDHMNKVIFTVNAKEATLRFTLEAL